ncbi:CopD family protein [Sphingorhabdus sp.]|uniref:CopD family protein n=1 Tax=Sphingorhabdus sp. TaxID=1902408 RepID=UPI00391AF36A
MEVAFPLLRFAHYGLLLGLFGVTAFRSFGLQRAFGQNGTPSISIAITVSAIAALIVTVALMLVSIAAMMALPVSQVEWATVKAMLLSTELGWAFLARVGFLIAAVTTCILFRRSAHSHAIAALWFGLAVATLPWSGHAAASDGLLGTAHRVNDAVHLLAAGLWLGAIGWFLYLTAAAHRRLAIVAAPLLADVHKFAPLGILLVAIVAGTGAINAQLIFGIENSLRVVRTNYGWLLAVKILVVGVMLSFGARNAWIGKQQAASNDIETNLAKLRASLGAELTMAIVVIGLMAFIGMMSPMGD